MYCEIPRRLRINYNIKIHLFSHNQQIYGDSIEIIKHEKSASDKKKRREYRRVIRDAFVKYLKNSESEGFGKVLEVWLAQK
jgi:hypothetical protein